MKIPPILSVVALLLLSLVLPAGLFAANQAERAPTLRDKIYSFEHRLLPQWVHGTDGTFYADLRSGSLDRLRQAATENVSKDFAAALIVRSLADPEGVLIQFPTPKTPPLCYFVFIEKAGDHFSYVTLEKTEDILGSGAKSVMGQWSADGGHLNFGQRNYTKAEKFLADVQSRKKKD